jgi:hypothetical protein
LKVFCTHYAGTTAEAVVNHALMDGHRERPHMGVG